MKTIYVYHLRTIFSVTKKAAIHKHMQFARVLCVDHPILSLGRVNDTYFDWAPYRIVLSALKISAKFL